MLVRAYRVTDRVGLVILKIFASITALMLDGAQIVLNVGRRGGGGILGLLGLLAGGLLAVLGLLWRGIRAVFGLFFSTGAKATALAGRGARRVTGRAATTARTTASKSMARRAARSELDVKVVEDPLRAQNRFLSAVVVVVLAVLVGVVIFATGNNDDSGTPVVVPAVADLNVANNTTPTPQTAGIAALATPVPTATPLPELLQGGGSLAFVVREMGQTDIWAVGIDSRNPIRITNSPEDDRDPAWSPDGQRIAYASRRDGNWEIYILDLRQPDAAPRRMTFPLGFQAKPVWSPDGAFIAYESYQNDNLDIYYMGVDDTSIVPQALPGLSDAPDYAPSWSPAGRQIAYVSLRDGNQDIYVLDLDTSETFNLTATPSRDEDYPAWSPDGTLVAYSAVDQGIEKIFVKSVIAPDQPAQVISRGSNPQWSPDGSSLIFTVESIEGTQFIVEPYVQGGITTPVISVPYEATDPVWTDVPLPVALVNGGGLELGVDGQLYEEQVIPREGDPPYGLQALPGVGGAQLANLNDRVDDSFNALREQVNAKAGQDFLGTLEHVLWDLNYRPNPNEPNRNWHRTGRAFSINRNLLLGFPAQIEVVREDTDLETYWRVYVRVAEDAQDGELGEPLRRIPWEFVTTADGDVEAYDRGGRLQSSVPEGYYIDLTQIIEDYGWERVAAGFDWRANVFTRNYWMFIKPEGLTWYDAMREIYTAPQLGGFNPTPTPQPLPTSEASEG